MSLGKEEEGKKILLSLIELRLALSPGLGRLKQNRYTWIGNSSLGKGKERDSVSSFTPWMYSLEPVIPMEPITLAFF